MKNNNLKKENQKLYKENLDDQIKLKNLDNEIPISKILNENLSKIQILNPIENNFFYLIKII